MRLDSREKFENGFEEYLSMYGWHFSKKLCKFATDNMKKDGKKITPYTKEMIDMMLDKYGIELENKYGYDYVFVANMGKADYLGSSIVDEAHLAKYIKDYVDDEDGYPELPMSRYYGDIVAKGIPVIWEDMI
jgi:hypothetical protein